MIDADALARWLDGEDAGLLTVAADGTLSTAPPAAAAVLPGSFAPLHAGHERLAAVAAEIVGGAVALELSVVNVDKPPLAADEVRARLRQCRGRWAVALTRAPTFVEKARLLPGATFVVGWDTAARLVAPRYYGGDAAAMRAALAELAALRCRFLVAGRLVDGTFRTLAEIDLPAGSAALFEAIPERRFRLDLSSTQLRGAR